jgi:hypothetical protein
LIEAPRLGDPKYFGWCHLAWPRRSRQWRSADLIDVTTIGASALLWSRSSAALIAWPRGPFQPTR